MCGLIYEAAEMRADAAYLRARAAADGNPELLKIAATISTSARQSERDAWEFAVREAEAMRQRGGQSQTDRVLENITKKAKP
ncbi:MAG TPA: hypothetical protein VHP33_17595 [Polyangiaceae bacterium]|nr:hypothetical protein [Polyangiaceae bacterium]